MQKQGRKRAAKENHDFQQLDTKNQQMFGFCCRERHNLGDHNLMNLKVQSYPKNAKAQPKRWLVLMDQQTNSIEQIIHPIILTTSPLEVISMKGYHSDTLSVSFYEPAYRLFTYQITFLYLLSTNMVRVSPLLILPNRLLFECFKYYKVWPLQISPFLQQMQKMSLLSQQTHFWCLLWEGIKPKPIMPQRVSSILTLRQQMPPLGTGCLLQTMSSSSVRFLTSRVCPWATLWKCSAKQSICLSVQNAKALAYFWKTCMLLSSFISSFICKSMISSLIFSFEPRSSSICWFCSSSTRCTQATSDMLSLCLYSSSLTRNDSFCSSEYKAKRLISSSPVMVMQKISSLLLPFCSFYSQSAIICCCDYWNLRSWAQKQWVRESQCSVMVVSGKLRLLTFLKGLSKLLGSSTPQSASSTFISTQTTYNFIRKRHIFKQQIKLQIELAKFY